MVPSTRRYIICVGNNKTIQEGCLGFPTTQFLPEVATRDATVLVAPVYTRPGSNRTKNKVRKVNFCLTLLVC